MYTDVVKSLSRKAQGILKLKREKTVIVIRKNIKELISRLDRNFSLRQHNLF